MTSQNLKYGGIHDSHFEYIQTTVCSLFLGRFRKTLHQNKWLTKHYTPRHITANIIRYPLMNDQEKVFFCLSKIVVRYLIVNKRKWPWPNSTSFASLQTGKDDIKDNTTEADNFFHQLATSLCKVNKKPWLERKADIQ